MSNSLTGKLPEDLFNSSSLTTICLQQNHFVGSIPHVLAKSSPLKYLSLKENNLSGSMPQSLGNLSSLVSLGVVHNNLVGSIPQNLGHIPTLEQINLSINNLSGDVPPSLFNMSSLKYLGLGINLLTGRLPSEIGYTLPNIQALVLTSNRFDGTIPVSLVNASQLVMIYMAINMLTGPIPFFGSLPNLEILDVGGNMLEADDWDFLSSLSNCTRLTSLLLDSNNLQGILPVSIGNLTNNLEILWLRVNKISGAIPSEIGNLKSLTELLMGYNLFSGSIPSTIVHLDNLIVLEIQQCKLSGRIPGSIGNLSHLNDLHLAENNLSGSIPASIGQCRQLKSLNLSHNSLVGGIPNQLLKLSSLSIYLDLSNNHFSGEIPEEVGNLVNLNQLNISNNRLSSNIPSSIGQCVLLVSLQMQSNFLEGSIPQTFMNLVGLNEMDLSQNNLSGTIPGFLASLTNLHVLNLSFNDFEGVVPEGGVFSYGGGLSIQGNDRLCTHNPALHLPVCTKLATLKREGKSLVAKIVVPIVVVIVTIVSLACFVTILKRKKKQSVPHFKQHDSDLKRITYQDITKATDQFSSANLIGSGSFGIVYKGYLELEDNTVAIKIFNLDIFGANQSFIAECATLKAVRHRNLVKIITLCCSVDLIGKEFKALVFKYMHHGNLEMWLHQEVHEQGQRKILGLSQRISIALDVAFALDYLHNHCEYPLIHCDLKPSNVLLDHDMTACIGDFGLARFLCTRAGDQSNSSSSLNHLKGSIGYIAPEYGMSAEISTSGDVYSFGVLLLEMITGCRPTDEKFSSGTTLHESVCNAFPSDTYEILDPVLLQDESNNTNDVMNNCIIPLVRVGLSCSLTQPKARWEMGEVCTEILAIKDAFSRIHGV
ncbi:unnamed protein product [Urochloa humidicola]